MLFKNFLFRIIFWRVLWVGFFFVRYFLFFLIFFDKGVMCIDIDFCFIVWKVLFMFFNNMV